MTPTDIIARVAAIRGLTVTKLRGPEGHRAVASARHECCWLLRESTEMSLPEIGRALGNRHHSTILAAVRKIQARIDADPEYGAGLLSMVSPKHADPLAFARWEVEALQAKLAEKRARLRQLSGEAGELRSMADDLRGAA